MEPINYLAQVADPFAQSLQGLKLGAGMAENQQKQAAAEQQRLATQQYNQALSRLQSPTATAADFENMIMISGKDQAANLKTVMESRDARQNKAALKQVSPIAFALKTGNVNEGVALLTQYAEAARNSGDTQEATYLTQMAEQAKAQPENVGNLFASKMTLIPGGKDALENLLKMTAERRTEAQAPAELRQKIASADKAVADADKAKVDATYAEKNALADLKKKAADLGLTSAQTNKALVETRNLDTTGKMLSLDFAAAAKGLPFPSKKAEGGGTATEDERKAAGWLAQGTNAYQNMLKAMYTKEGKATGAEKPGTYESLPLTSYLGASWSRSTDRQKFMQASSSLSEALLRAATGAGVNEAEAKQKLEEITPLFTDDDDTRKQKLASIPVYLESLKLRAGRAAPQDYQVPVSPMAALTFTLPSGVQKTFPDQKSLEDFKKAAGIK